MKKLLFTIVLLMSSAFAQTTAHNFDSFVYRTDTLKNGFVFGIWNPVGSGKNIVIDELQVSATFDLGDITTEYLVFGTAPNSIFPLGCSLFPVANTNTADSTQSVATVYGQPCSPDPSLHTGNGSQTDTFLLNKQIIVGKATPSITIVPGRGWVIYSAVGNPPASGTFYVVYGLKWHEQ